MGMKFQYSAIGGRASKSQNLYEIFIFLSGSVTMELETFELPLVPRYGPGGYRDPRSSSESKGGSEGVTVGSRPEAAKYHIPSSRFSFLNGQRDLVLAMSQLL